MKLVDWRENDGPRCAFEGCHRTARKDKPPFCRKHTPKRARQSQTL